MSSPVKSISRAILSAQALGLLSVASAIKVDHYASADPDKTPEANLCHLIASQIKKQQRPVDKRMTLA